MTGYPPPLDSGRNPFELFVLLLGVISGFPLLLGAPAPGSTTALLGNQLAFVWGCILCGGCIVALVGVWWTWWGWVARWRGLGRMRLTEATGLAIEQVGLVAVGVGCMIYAYGVHRAGEPPGRYIAAALVCALGLACWWRAGQIRRWVKAAIREVSH